MLDFHITVMADVDKFNKAIQELKELFMAKIDDVLLEVAEIENQGDSIIALVQGLAAQLEEVKNDPAKVQEVVDRLRNQTQEFVNAIQTFQPPTPPEPPSA